MAVRSVQRVVGLGIVLAAMLVATSPAEAATTVSLSPTGRLTVTGTGAAETIVLRAVGSSTIRVIAPGVGRNVASNTVRSIQVNAAGGNDTVRIEDAQRAFTTTRPTVLDGGGGGDTLLGGRGPETLRGGNGNDTATGLRGDDRVELGAGADTAVWNVGDGNDQVEGGNGADTQRAVGTTGADTVTLVPQAGRVRLAVGTGSTRTRFVETVDVQPGDGADTVDAAALTGLGLVTLHVGLGTDAAADDVTLRGTPAADVAQAAVSTGTVTVTGLGPAVQVDGSVAAHDRLTLAGGGGSDTLTGATGLAAVLRLSLDGGDADDVLNGGNGADTLLGGAGSDTVDGNGGNDTAFLGDGNDTFVWDPGDGSDVVEGQGGVDSLRFNGSAGAEILSASANGGRLLFTRNVGNIVMDTDDVEALTVNALGSTDTITVNNLAATDVRDVTLNLGVNSAGDGASDAVTVNGTVGDDVFQNTAIGGNLVVRQPDLDVTIDDPELANDSLTLNGSSGNDGFFSSSSGISVLVYTFNGGNGNDVLVGTAGADTPNCDANTDLADGGAGVDVSSGCENQINVP